jgi:hypothetical protein
MKEVNISAANDGIHKKKAEFSIDGKHVKTTYFGAKGMNDFISYSKISAAEGAKHKSAYLARHRKNENWNDERSAGALSRYILWNLPTLSKSIADYKKRFNFKS